MKACRFSLSALALLVAAALPLHAQFNAPTPDELKMTSDPAAPGAAAVYLDYQEVSNDPIHFHSVYARIKVLTEKGKELAKVSIPYESTSFKVTDIKGRTIHPDGTITPLVGKPEELLLAKSGELQFSRKVFTLPSVEVGSILEYRYEIRYDDYHVSSPEWDLQKPYFVRKARYEFIPFKGFLPGLQNATSISVLDEHGNPADTLMWSATLPNKMVIKADAQGHYVIALNNILPAPDEEFMPPVQNLIYRIKFYYKSAHSTPQFWIDEAKYWSKEVDHFASVDKELREAAASLVAPTDSELDKAKKIYAAVQALDNTDFSRAKSDSERRQLKMHDVKKAEDVWKEKSGNSSEIAQLYLALARAAGLNASGMIVSDRRDHTFDFSYLNFHQLDDLIVVLKINDKFILLDPGEKMCPFETLHWRHTNTVGIKQDANVRDLATTPNQPYIANKITRNGEFTLDEAGNITGQYRIIMTGQEALYWRQRALVLGSDELKKSFDEWVKQSIPEGVEAHIDHFLAIDDPYTNLIAVVNIKGSYGTATAKRFILPGFFFESNGNTHFVKQEKRITAVDLHYPDQILEQITYHLPAGLTLDSKPADQHEIWKEHSSYIAKIVPQGSKQITIARSLSTAFTFAKPEEYSDLRGFYQKVAQDDAEQLVFSRGIPVSGGN